MLINTLTDLIAPAGLKDRFFVDAFTEFETSVLYFADQAVTTRTRLGHKVIVGFGNYVHNLFCCPFRLGVLYEFMYKGKDDVEVKCDGVEGTFNTCLLEERTKQHAHTIVWDLSYKFDDCLEVNFGSSHVVAGKNVPRNYEIFASMVAVFD